jgi:hypothetical protein
MLLPRFLAVGVVLVIAACAPAEPPPRAPSPTAVASPKASVAPPPTASAATAAAPARPSRPATQLVLAGSTGCALLEAGDVDCWGGEQAAAPATLAGVRDAVEVAAGAGMGVAAVLRSGRVRHHSGSTEARELEKLRDVAHVSMYYPALCAALQSGKVTCYRGEPWDDERKVERAPEGVANLSDVTGIDVGAHFGCVVHGNGKVSCFRHTLPAGQALRAAPVPGVSDAVRVDVGTSMACALRKDRKTVCFSLGMPAPKTAELGSADAMAVEQDDGYSAPLVCLADGSTVRCQRPEVFGSGHALPSVSTDAVTFPGAAPLRAVAAVGHAVCALDARGAVHCFGHNRSGILGQPDPRNLTTPAPVEGLAAVRSVATGIGFSCALSKGGEVFCWGKSPHARGARGAEEPDPSVKKVSGLPKIERLVASKGYACGFTQDGQAHCFFGTEWEGKPTRASYRVPVLDSARALILPEMGFTNYAAVVDKAGQLLLGPSTGFDTIEKIALGPVPGFAKVRHIASSYWRLYVQDEAGAVSRLDIRDGKVSGEPARFKQLDGAKSLSGEGFALLGDGAVVHEHDGTVTKVRPGSPWVALHDGPGLCGSTPAGELSCMDVATKQERTLARDAKQVSRSGSHRGHTCLVDSRARVQCVGDCGFGQCGAKVGLFHSATPVDVHLP